MIRIFKPGSALKVQPPREPRRRSRITWRLTCPHCTCEFGITDDERCEAWDPINPSTVDRETYGPCPHCWIPMSYRDGAVRVNEKGRADPDAALR